MTFDAPSCIFQEFVDYFNLGLDDLHHICAKFSANYSSTDIPGLVKKRTLVIVSCVFVDLAEIQCACVTLAEKLTERLNLLSTFPGGHSIKANIQCGHRKVVFSFLNKRIQSGRNGHCRNEVGILGRDIDR